MRRPFPSDERDERDDSDERDETTLRAVALDRLVTTPTTPTTQALPTMPTMCCWCNFERTGMRSLPTGFKSRTCEAHIAALLAEVQARLERRECARARLRRRQIGQLALVR